MSNDERCAKHPNARAVRMISNKENRKQWMCAECSDEYQKESNG